MPRLRLLCTALFIKCASTQGSGGVIAPFAALLVKDPNQAVKVVTRKDGHAAGNPRRDVLNSIYIRRRTLSVEKNATPKIPVWHLLRLGGCILLRNPIEAV